eukprot:5885181-Amphidinium_carterae.1
MEDTLKSAVTRAGRQLNLRISAKCLVKGDDSCTDTKPEAIVIAPTQQVALRLVRLSCFGALYPASHGPGDIEAVHDRGDRLRLQTHCALKTVQQERDGSGDVEAAVLPNLRVGLAGGRM